MRVFVLSTGRCGSTTFHRASSHLTNFTSGHETRRAGIGEGRFDYPDDHIESDNRLSWFLGGLEKRFDPADTFYVHLTRDPGEVAESYLARWESTFRANMIRAFAHGLVAGLEDYEPEARLEACHFYVETVTSNIQAFVRDKPHRAEVRLETGRDDWCAVMERIGAEGDLGAGAAEWEIRHNARPTRAGESGPPKGPTEA